MIASSAAFSRGLGARVGLFGLAALVVWYVHRGHVALHLPIGPHEVAGAVIALLLAFRTNAAYARFWEGRTLFGTIVNACRSVTRVVAFHSRCSADEHREFATWVVVFAHATRGWLRGEREDGEVARLLDGEALEELRSSDHPPLHAASQLSRMLAAMVSRGEIDPTLAAQAEQRIGTMVDGLGGCERIRRTPTPREWVALLRGCIVVFLASLPLALVETLGAATPLVVMLAAWPLLTIEALGHELDDPFGPGPNDLPLDALSDTLERDLADHDKPKAAA